MQDSAKASRKVPPQYSPLAFSMKRPPTLMPSVISNSSSSETTPLFQRRDRGDDLEGRAGGLGGGEGLARERPHVAVLGVEHGDAAGPPGQRRDRGFLQGGVDRRLHRRARLRRRFGQDAAGRLLAARRRDGEQLAARLAREAAVEGPLEAADPDRRFRREAVRGQLRLVLFGRFADFAGDVDRRASRSGVRVRVAGPSASGVPSAARIGARGASSVSRFERLAAAQAGEDEVGSPVDAAFGPGQVELFARRCRRRRS